MENLGKMWRTEAQSKYPKKFLIITTEKRSEYNESYGEVLGFDDEDEWLVYRMKNKNLNDLAVYGDKLLEWINDRGGLYLGKIPVDTL